MCPQAELCSRCGGPSKADVRECSFCGAAFTSTAAAPAAAAAAASNRELENFIGALLIEHAMPKALELAVTSFLDADPDAPKIASAVVAIAIDCERQLNTKLDAKALTTIVTHYRNARADLQTQERTELCIILPGGKEYRRDLGRDDMGKLESF